MSRSLAVRPVADRVSAGIDLLDRETPGWDKDIDLDALRLSSCEQCVLGQLYGTFGDGLDFLDLHDDSAARLGFQLYEGEGNLYGTLTDAWVAAICARRLAVSR
jgi:hypothetical protein